MPDAAETRITWAYVPARVPAIPWSAVVFGIEEAWCAWRLGIGRAELALADSDDARIVSLAICADEWDARGIMAELARAEPASVQHLTDRVWLYLALSWVADGHAEPGTDPAPPGSDRSHALESVWARFGEPRELGFLVPWMPLEPGEPSVRPSDAPWWQRVEPRLREWMQREHDALARCLA